MTFHGLPLAGLLGVGVSAFAANALAALADAERWRVALSWARRRSLGRLLTQLQPRRRRRQRLGQLPQPPLQQPPQQQPTTPAALAAVSGGSSSGGSSGCSSRGGSSRGGAPLAFSIAHDGVFPIAQPRSFASSLEIATDAASAARADTTSVAAAPAAPGTASLGAAPLAAVGASPSSDLSSPALLSLLAAASLHSPLARLPRSALQSARHAQRYWLCRRWRRRATAAAAAEARAAAALERTARKARGAALRRWSDESSIASLVAHASRRGQLASLHASWRRLHAHACSCERGARAAAHAKRRWLLSWQVSALPPDCVGLLLIASDCVGLLRLLSWQVSALAS